MSAATGSGPRHLAIDQLAPVVQNQGSKVLVEVYSQQHVARCEGLVAEANAAQLTDKATKEAAERTLLQLHDALKMVEARRGELKKPIIQSGKAIDEIAAKLAEPMDAAKRSLQGRIIAYAKVERDRAEAARREAEERARVEREAAEAAHAKAVAEAKAKAEAEAKELADVLGEPVVVEPEPVAPPPAPAPSAPPVQAAAPSAVTTRKVQRLEITDASLIPYRVGEQVLMHPDHVAIKRVLALGIEVPGARLVEDEQVAMSTRRA
jgi:colicin import membrane protein